MPVSYAIKEGYVHCRAAGTYSFDEALANYDSAFHDRDFRPGYNILIDIFDSGVTRSYDEIRRLVDMLGEQPRFGRKCAVLVNPDHPVRYGLARMLGSLAEFRNIEFGIFFNLDQARKFLTSGECDTVRDSSGMEH